MNDDDIVISDGQEWIHKYTKEHSHGTGHAAVVGVTKKWVFLVITSGPNAGTQTNPEYRKWPKATFKDDYTYVDRFDR